MNSDAAAVLLIIVLVALCAGDPDLLDALTKLVMSWSVCK